MIRVVDVTHHYGVRPVLRKVNFEVARGELLALMGPNGSGKSTLMAVLAGVQAPLKGYVEIDGKRRKSSSQTELEIRQKVVYLAAEPWVPTTMTGRQWLLAVGQVWSIEIERLIDHAERLLDLFDLKEKGDSPILSYSTGQRKKIALAGALITEAPIMLLDEPFAGGLDPTGILALRRVLQHRAQGDHFTIVFATPVPELVEELADRVAIINNGEIAAIGSIPSLREQTGIGGSLDEVYEQIVRPQSLQSIDRYLSMERM